MFNFILHSIVLSVPIVNSTKFMVLLFLFSPGIFLFKKQKGRSFVFYQMDLKMLLVSFAWIIKFVCNLYRARLCVCHFPASKHSVAPHCPQNSSWWYWKLSMMLAPSSLPTLDVYHAQWALIPSFLSLSSPRFLSYMYFLLHSFPCKAHRIHLCWLATLLSKFIFHAVVLWILSCPEDAPICLEAFWGCWWQW